MNLKPRIIAKEITTAGTREQLTTAGLTSPSVTIQALKGNTGVVYVGDELVSATNGIELSPGDSMSLGNNVLGSGDTKISLKDIWLDVATSADDVYAIYYERV